MAWQCLLAAAAVAACGCSEEKNSPPPKPTTKELATKQFNRLVKEVRRRVNAQDNEAVPGGPIVKWSTEVTDKLIPPPSPGLLWRGEVTIATQSSVTVITLPDAEEERDSQQKKPRRTTEDDFLLEETGDPDLDGTFGGLAGSATQQPTQAPAMSVIDSDETEVYELIFEDDRWRLVTPLDENTEMGLIFRIAIKSQ